MFPCPICKGEGGWKEVILDDGSGSYDECGYCFGEEMIVVDSELHRKIKKRNLSFRVWEQFCKRDVATEAESRVLQKRVDEHEEGVLAFVAHSSRKYKPNSLTIFRRSVSLLSC